MMGACLLAAAPLGAAPIPAPFEQAIAAVTLAEPVDPGPPVLSGTEGFDIAAFRAQFGEPGSVPFPDIQTARAIVDGISEINTGAARLTSFEIGFAAIEYNWFAATVAGSQELAGTLAGEIKQLRQLHQSLVDSVVFSLNVPPFASAFYTRPEAGRLAMNLRRMAGSAVFEQFLPKAIDPEGYLAARLRAVHDRLKNSADLILAAGEAYAIYY